MAVYTKINHSDILSINKNFPIGPEEVGEILSLDIPVDRTSASPGCPSDVHGTPIHGMVELARD